MNVDVLLNGSRICGLVVLRIMGFENDGFSEWNLLSGRFVSFVVIVMLMLCDVVIVMKYGWFGIFGSVRLYCCGFVMMFFIVCSFGM